MTQRPRISVIVPVWNGVGQIPRLLAALRRQTVGAEAFEIIVVDNGSTDGTFELLEREGGVHLLREPVPSSYAARNRGLDMVRGELVAFTDADCVPDDTWLEAALAASARQPDVGILAGRIELFEEPDPAAARSPGAIAYERLFSFDQARSVRFGVCVTANWVSPKAVFDRLGPFDPSLKSGGDGQMAKRARAAGLAIVYVPQMIVGHPVRGSVEELVGKRRRVLGGKWRSYTARFPLARWIASVGVQWVRESATIVRTRYLPWEAKASALRLSTHLFATGVREVVRLWRGGEPRRS